MVLITAIISSFERSEKAGIDKKNLAIGVYFKFESTILDAVSNSFLIHLKKISEKTRKPAGKPSPG